jgi:hypothetical protein
LNIGNHSYHNAGVTMQLPKATSLAAIQIHPTRLYCHWMPNNYVIDKENSKKKKTVHFPKE